jgi:hypothetical protein
MWQPGTIKNNQCVFGLYLGEVDVQFQFKEKNACGWSPIHSGSATIPHYSGCVVDNPTGTGDSNVETKIKVSISPNPVNDKLNIKLLNFDILKSPSDLKIFDIYGNVVLQKSLTDVVNIINVDQLKCSIYLIMIIYNNDVIYKSKLIKQ